MASSFTEKVREELLQTLQQETNGKRRRQYLYLAILASARFPGRSFRINSRQSAWIRFLESELRSLEKADVHYFPGRDMDRLQIDDAASVKRLRQVVQRLLTDGAEAFVRAADDPKKLLAVLFLACGSMADPGETYQLDFSLTRTKTAEFCRQLLAAIGLSVSVIEHRAYVVLYTKEGGKLSDFLLLAGAHKALLAFENLRVEKELRNQVNRLVNCDNANAERLAGSSARQWEAIHYLQEKLGLDQLPEDLRAAAEARLANPGLSLKELGALMRPAIGKSGMNHRMHRLLEQAERLKQVRGD